MVVLCKQRSLVGQKIIDHLFALDNGDRLVVGPDGCRQAAVSDSVSHHLAPPLNSNSSRQLTAITHTTVRKRIARELGYASLRWRFRSLRWAMVADFGLRA
jgi:hypothetical protein